MFRKPRSGSNCTVAAFLINTPTKGSNSDGLKFSEGLTVALSPNRLRVAELDLGTGDLGRNIVNFALDVGPRWRAVRSRSEFYRFLDHSSRLAPGLAEPDECLLSWHECVLSLMLAQIL
jgi:hypothetical protein